MMGIPLVFTSYTRSVFEVNKMLVMRVSILVTYVAWFIRYRLQVDNNALETGPDVYTNRWFSWKKIGVEIPLILWCITNLITFFLSEDMRLSLIGSYDRWEGIVTVFNYIMIMVMIAKLVTTKKQFFWIIGATLVATFFSSIYGVFQSLGFDYMNWSVDATARVFACINNPVHYCAYMAMSLPISISLLFYLNRLPQKHTPLLTSQHRFLYMGLLACSILLVGSFAFDDFFTPSFLQALVILILSWLTGWLPMVQTQLSSFKQKLPFICFSAFLFLILTFDMVSFDRLQWALLATSMLFFFIFSALPSWRSVLIRALFIGSLTIFYAQLASFSRATFVGFGIGMPVLYFYLLDLFNTKSFKQFILDAILTLMVTGVFILAFSFRIHQESFFMGVATFSTLLVLCLSWIFFHHGQDHGQSLLPRFISSSFIIALFGLLLFGIPAFLPASFVLISKLCVIGIMALLLYRFQSAVPIFIRLALVVGFSLVQFASVSAQDSLIYFSLMILLVLFARQSFQDRFDIWSFSFILMLGVTAVVPTAPLFFGEIRNSITHVLSPLSIVTTLSIIGLFTLFYAVSIQFQFSAHRRNVQYVIGSGILAFVFIIITSLFLSTQSASAVDSVDADALRVAQNIKQKTGAYDIESAGNNMENNARLSMWRTSIPWIKDYIFFGSGQDTIKFIYPLYREPIYGILEGGHHLTPDRLHNEYLNTLATRGVIGFLIFYVYLLFTWLYITLKKIYTYRHSPYMLFSMACISGCFIQLAQLMFNFSVVATAVIFYFLMGMSLAIVNSEDFHTLPEGK